VTGEEFLRHWATDIVANEELKWYQRFYSMVEALEIIGEIDIDVARSIGQDIRAGLTARTGQPTWDFYLGSRGPKEFPLRGVPILYRPVPPNFQCAPPQHRCQRRSATVGRTSSR
jgi:hypothetical protein